MSDKLPLVTILTVETYGRMLPMSSSPPARLKATPYHHGDLRKALLDSARLLVGRIGSDTLSLRQVARESGVSHAAAYHHFADKNDLLRSLAVLAFDDLTQELTDAVKASGSAAEALEKLALAYLRFGMSRAPEIRFMFRRDLCMPRGEPDPVEVASLRSQDVVTTAIRDGQKAGQLREGDIAMDTLTFWSIAHGLTMIALETPAFKEIDQATAEQLMRLAVATLLQGMLPPAV